MPALDVPLAISLALLGALLLACAVVAVCSIEVTGADVDAWCGPGTEIDAERGR